MCRNHMTLNEVSRQRPRWVRDGVHRACFVSSILCFLALFLAANASATVYGCYIGGDWRCYSGTPAECLWEFNGSMQKYSSYQTCKDHNKKQTKAPQKAPAKQIAKTEKKPAKKVASKAEKKKPSAAPATLKKPPKKIETVAIPEASTAEPEASEPTEQPAEARTVKTPAVKPEQPESATNLAARTELLAAKTAALRVMRDAADLLPTITSTGLRSAFEATIDSVGEALKSDAPEVINARAAILSELVVQTLKSQKKPVASPSDTGQPVDADAGKPASQAAGQIAAVTSPLLPSPVATLPPQKRVALIIGNSTYQFGGELPNPRNDAKLISATLKQLGFDVVEGEDLDKAAMERKIREFVTKQASADVALFFYAGHGMQVTGRNYLIPIDAKLEDATSVDFETIPADRVLDYMAGEGKVAIALLDACRDNPLSRRFARALGASRSAAVGRGLAIPTALGGGILIGFATAPGEVALDGDDENSPFTQALLKHLPEKGLEIQQVMTKVKADVYDITNGQQSPWHNSDLRKAFYLNP
jgi:hypothetical protein